ETFPNYYEGKWLITDWSRGWIMAVEIDDSGNYISMERFLPNEELIGPNDMVFGPDGDLYVLEYGRGPYVGNPEARLIKFSYNSGKREPKVITSVNKNAGALPFTLELSSKGTKDYDGDHLKYEWKITKTSDNKVLSVENSDTTIVIE